MTSSSSPFADLRARHDALVAAEPKLRMRERATRLGATEAQLVAAGCGITVVRLAGPAQALLKAVGSLGEVMALSRNDHCVHERHGRYDGIEAEGPVGLVLGPDIDLRLFFTQWKHAFAVTENGRDSLQFFDGQGEAVHKVYRTEASDASAWNALVAQFGTTENVWPEALPLPASDQQDQVADAQALRTDWLALKDTHEFFGMLRRYKVTRLAAMGAAGRDLAQPVPAGTVESVLESVAASGLPIMCFVANRGIVQIHTGPVHKLVRTGPWFNVLDPKFNLHLNTEAIASTWVVNKPTTDGWVTSLEVFSSTGEMIVQFFGERKPGKPELPAWRELLLGLCAEPLAA